MAAEATGGEIEELSARIRSYPRDLLRRFSGNGGHDEPTEAAGGDLGEIELSLGLSLGGCFGAEPIVDKRIVRSSSIASMSMFPIEHTDFPAVPPLARACSVPTETTEEERRKRKEMQSLKRLEAKRKRLEKRNSLSKAKDRKAENLDEEMEGGQVPVAKAELSGCPGIPGSTQIVGKVNGVVVPPELPKWAMGAGRAGGRPMDVSSRCYGPISQGSIGSQGSCSSVVSDLESKPIRGFDVSGLSNCTEVRSQSTIPPVPDYTNHEASAAPLTPMAGKPANPSREEDKPSKKKSMGRTNGAREMERNMMEEMPCVSTRGDGPNGRRIEGFLYKYRKGEEVRIVCVCHGSFLTPAEFVKHAGGGDVTHPLRHIVVNPTPFAFL